MIRKWDIMDFNNQSNSSPSGNQPYNEPQTFRNPGLNMASTSLFLGVAAICTAMTVFMPLLFGSLAIVFALLSKGYGKKMLTQAKVGFICGLGSFCITTAMFVSSFIMLISNPDILVEVGRQYDATCKAMYGQTSEEMFGYSFEDMMEDYADLFR